MRSFSMINFIYLKLSVFERRIQENEECENAKNQHFQTELEAATKKCGELRSMLLKADSQCETLLVCFKILFLYLKFILIGKTENIRGSK
jgi:hypothetical protein